MKPSDLTPELIAQILSGTNREYTLGPYNNGQEAIYRKQPGTEATFDFWDPQGKYLESGESTGMSEGQMLGLLLASIAGGSMLSGLSGAGATAGGMGAEFGGAAGEILGGSTAGYTPGMGAAAGGGALGTTGLNAMRAGEIANYATNGSLPGSAAVASGLGGGGGLGGLLNPNLATLAGGVLGAIDSQDKTSTTSREPWAPAQPLLKALIGRTGDMAGKYLDQPFSEGQQTAYGNLTGLLNTINQQAPGLMAGFGANASGANNFDRSNPRKQLTGSSFDMSQFMPGLLNLFPPKRG